MKTKYSIVFLFSFWMSSDAFAQNPIIQNILNDVRMDSVKFFVRELSGDTTTVINGNTNTILSRHKDSPGNEMAFVYLKQRIMSCGLQPDSQQFSATGKNIFTEQTGTVFPNKKILICAHYDNMPVYPIYVNAPGADDNASGTAAVVEAMRVLSHYSFPYTIVYAWWDEEEQGLMGSNYYATLAALNDDTILGVINLDMIAWESNNDSLLLIQTASINNSLQLATTMDNMNSLYAIGLNTSIMNPGTSASDHASFWSEGFTAIGVSEDYNSDFNPFFHSPADSFAQLNIPYYEKICKLTYATLASLAGDTNSVSGVEELISKNSILLSNYPNPFSGNTTISYQLSVPSDVTITIYNPFGEKVTALVRPHQQAGDHEIIWDANGLSSGMYLCELKTISDFDNSISSNSRRLILLKN